MVTKSKRRQAKRRATEAVAAPAPATRKRRKVSRTINEDFPPTPPGFDSDPQYVPEPVRLKVILGDRASTDKDVESLTWTCGSCKKVNAPRRGLIADYPVLQCECREESDIEFDFSLGNLMINNQHPVIQENVKNQKKDGCTLAASSTSMEITLKMQSILAGEEVDGKEVIIDMDDLHLMYDNSLEIPGLEKVNKWDEETISYLAELARIYGVTAAESDGSTRYKIAGYVRVKLNFYDIVRVLADGHPLTTAITDGKNFEKLKPGQIYKAPCEEKIIDGQHSRSGHAIVLIGAGRRRKTNYYHFMNSWGKFFCIEKDGRYGFGMIRASDINVKPFKFIRYRQEADFHRRLASTV